MVGDVVLEILGAGIELGREGGHGCKACGRTRHQTTKGRPANRGARVDDYRRVYARPRSLYGVQIACGAKRKARLRGPFDVAWSKNDYFLTSSAAASALSATSCAASAVAWAASAVASAAAAAAASAALVDVGSGFASGVGRGGSGGVGAFSGGGAGSAAASAAASPAASVAAAASAASLWAVAVSFLQADRARTAAARRTIELGVHGVSEGLSERSEKDSQATPVRAAIRLGPASIVH